MKIISGQLGRRVISVPKKMPLTRPTTDLAKMGLFNILHNRITFENIRTLDLFGGTGSISYELASRGALSLTIVEKNAEMVQSIKYNMEQFKINNMQIIKMDVLQFLQTCTHPFDFIFAGPPYDFPSITALPKLIAVQQLLNPNAYFVLEHTTNHRFENEFQFEFERNYGTTIFSFFCNK